MRIGRSAARRTLACGLAASLIGVFGLSGVGLSPAPAATSAKTAAPTAVTPGGIVRVFASGLIPSQRCTLELIPLRRRNGQDGRGTKLPCGRTDRERRINLRFRFPTRPPGRPPYRSGERVAIEVATVAPAGGGAAATRLTVVIR